MSNLQAIDLQLYKDRMYQIIGAAMSLYNELGSGYSEPIYQECLSVICTEKDILGKGRRC